MSTSAAPGRAAPSLQSAAMLPTEVAMPAPGAPGAEASGAAEPRRRFCALVQPGSTSSPSSSGLALPSDLVAEAARRLSLAMLVVAVIDFFYSSLFLTIWSEHADLVGQVVGVIALVVSLVSAYMLRSCPRTQREIVLVAALYEVAITFGFSLVEYWHLPPNHGQVSDLISWTCIIIAFFPVLVPGRVRQIVIASLAAAAANSLAFVIAFQVREQSMPAPDAALSLLLPPYIAAGLSLIPARVVSGLGRHVSQARQLGSYRLVERLGAGGMGEVWRAEHRLLARPAAIKLIRLDAGSDLEDRARVVERFEREAQATASLESPHTVELYDFGVSDDGTFFYVMELLRGLDLERLVSRHGPQPPERVVHILQQACDSLADAHARGLIHRDIKPANILVTSRARSVDYVKVVDFGLVKLIRPTADDVRLSRAGEVHGTPAYMAPEEAVGSGELDGRADLYSLGCVAYWLLTGKLLFDESSSMKMALAHATREPAPPSRVATQAIPPDLEAIVMRCLAKDPAARPASAAELACELAAGGWARAWTAERAEAWWREHLPDRLPPAAPLRLAPSATAVQFSIDRAG